MQRVSRVAVIAATLFLSVSSSNAQQIEWKQTINLPKGFNMPQGVSADILGIQLGDNYQDARSKLEKIKADSDARPESKRLREGNRILQLPTQGGQTINVSFVGLLRLELSKLGNNDNPRGEEIIEVSFSAPSSGHQVLGLKRTLTYSRQDQQISISGLLDGLKAKFKSEPQLRVSGSERRFTFAFDNGRPNPASTNCPQHIFAGLDESNVRRFNLDGKCDVLLIAEAYTGISDNHARQVTFWLVDNERGKQNLLADYAFLNSYAASYRKQVGTAPKL